MEDLSHYGLFTAFNMVDAAHLAAGVEPQTHVLKRPIYATGAVHPKKAEVSVIIQAMEDGLHGAFCNIRSALLAPKGERKFPDWTLSTIQMTKFLEADFPCFPNDFELEHWMLIEK